MAIKENLIKTIKSELNTFINHAYLMKHVSAPFIDEDKMHLLKLMFEENGEYQNISEYVTTIMLVQIALDIHDTIDTSVSKTKAGVKERQLTVLAGDYYSSLYYRLLSYISDIRMVALLAESIQHINEKKMSLYKKDLDFNERILLIGDIDRELLRNVAEFLKLGQWIPVFSDFLMIKKLQNILENKESDPFAVVFHSQSNDVMMKKETEDTELLINKLKQRLTYQLSDIPELFNYFNHHPLLFKEADLSI